MMKQKKINLKAPNIVEKNSLLTKMTKSMFQINVKKWKEKMKILMMTLMSTIYLTLHIPQWP